MIEENADGTGTRYKCVLLKFSGEALCACEGGFGYDAAAVARLFDELAAVRREFPKLRLALVVGGGNIFRGSSAAAAWIERPVADSMGMMATVMNALAVSNGLKQRGVETRVMSAIALPQVAELYIRARALRHLDKGRVVIFAAGTGQPFFSTDSAAAQRALEIGADCLFKATKVSGVYDKDPRKHPDAALIPELTAAQYVADGIKVMDTTAVTLCRENKLPIRVFELAGNVSRALRGESVGSVILPT